jgi:hypothetical protein
MLSLCRGRLADYSYRLVEHYSYVSLHCATDDGSIANLFRLLLLFPPFPLFRSQTLLYAFLPFEAMSLYSSASPQARTANPSRQNGRSSSTPTPPPPQPTTSTSPKSTAFQTATSATPTPSNTTPPSSSTLTASFLKSSLSDGHWRSWEVSSRRTIRARRRGWRVRR